MELAQRLDGFRGRRGLAVLGASAVLAVALGYGFAVRARPVQVPPRARAVPGATGAAVRASLYVHVAGRVVRPGIVRLAAGARVADAIEAAGGIAPDGDADAINLAARVRDGDKVTVPSQGGQGMSSSGGAAGSSGGGAAARVNLNSATEADLDALPGIGPALAQRIIAFRVERGGFRSVKDLAKVSGIGPRKYEQLAALVSV